MAQELQCCPLDNLERPGGGEPLPLSYREKVSILFLWSAAAILALTGLGKISSAFGTSQILTTADPIVGIPFRVLLPLAGGLELIIAALCLWKRFPLRSRLLLVAWVSTLFVIYRIGLWAMDWHHPCGCMGSLAGVLHLNDATADKLMLYLLGYLVMGSYAMVVSCAWKPRTGGHRSSTCLRGAALATLILTNSQGSEPSGGLSPDNYRISGVMEYQFFANGRTSPDYVESLDCEVMKSGEKLGITESSCALMPLIGFRYLEMAGISSSTHQPLIKT